MRESFDFRSGAAEEVEVIFYIGSGDWMSRNLLRRVEVAAPIEDPQLKKRLWSILKTEVSATLAWLGICLVTELTFCARVQIQILKLIARKFLWTLQGSDWQFGPKISSVKKRSFSVRGGNLIQVPMPFAW